MSSANSSCAAAAALRGEWRQRQAATRCAPHCAARCSRDRQNRGRVRAFEPLPRCSLRPLDPLCLAYVASDGTVTVSYLFNRPRPPDVLEKREDDPNAAQDEDGD